MTLAPRDPTLMDAFVGDLDKMKPRARRKNDSE